MKASPQFFGPNRNRFIVKWLILSVCTVPIQCKSKPQSSSGILETRTGGGGGTGHFKGSSNPWFLTAEPIKTCYSVMPNSAVANLMSESKLRGTILDALKEWENFFLSHQPRQDERYKLPTKFALCDRPIELPNEEYDIIIRLGGKIKDYWHWSGQKTFPVLRRDLLGAAFQLSFDTETLRSHGHLWVKDHDYATGELKALIMHEVGHVLGFPHDATHIMDTELAAFIIEEDGVLPKVESPAWPFGFKKGSYNLTYQSLCQKQGPLHRGYTGRAPFSGLIAERRRRDPSRPPPSACLKVTLTSLGNVERPGGWSERSELVLSVEAHDGKTKVSLKGQFESIDQNRLNSSTLQRGITYYDFETDEETPLLVVPARVPAKGTLKFVDDGGFFHKSELQRSYPTIIEFDRGLSILTYDSSRVPGLEAGDVPNPRSDLGWFRFHWLRGLED